jgi:hypothetical protein
MAAKQLEREIGVTYKTAHRMFKLIRSMLSEDDDGMKLSGTVEADETYVGGRRRNAPRGGRPAQGDRTKTPVLAVVERGGRVRATIIERTVQQGSTVYTNELRSYLLLSARGYEHDTVVHGEKIYARGRTHTNTIEGFFSLVKGGLRGVYRGAVRREYVQS